MSSGGGGSGLRHDDLKECVALGARTSVVIRNHDGTTHIRLDVTAHPARRNGLERGRGRHGIIAGPGHSHPATTLKRQGASSP